MLLSLKLLMLLIAVFSAASPFSVNSRAGIQADNYVEVQCRGPGRYVRTHTPDQQRYAVGVLKHYANAPESQKPRSWHGNIFPHRYNTNLPDKSPAVDQMLDLMPQCNTRQRGKTWLTYPMMEGGNEFRERTRAGPDRVIVVADGTGQGPYSNYVFCGSIFHPLNPEDKPENAKDDEDYGSFEPCYGT